MQTSTAARPAVELTARAIVTGVVIGVLLTPCNVYSGLKIGWSFNMSIAALLLGNMFWIPIVRVFGGTKWGLYESNISQTTASSAASIISGGLVAPIPALAILSGENLPWHLMIVWVFGVSFLGIWVGWWLRDSLIVRSSLVFPAGMAAAETMRDIFSHSRDGILKVRALLTSLTAAAVFNFVDKIVWLIPRWSTGPGMKQLTFYLDPSLLLLGFGSIIGLRAGMSLIAGAILAWGVITPQLVAAGIVGVDPAAASWFEPAVSWLLWPGVALMLTSSLVSVGLAFRRSRERLARAAERERDERRGIRIAGLLAASVFVVILQIVVFDIHWTAALLALPMAVLLASVAARVTGETGIPPIGAIGKVSQFTFGVISPAEATTNLMTANVAGGAAGQSADLLNDLKAGHEIGATPQYQIVAQCFGVLAGSIAGSFIYLTLIPDPAAQLFTTEWPAPAVAVWKAVAELMTSGMGRLPPGAAGAAITGALGGSILALAAEYGSTAWRTWLPSGSALGLAFVLPASTSLTLFAGAALAALLGKLAPAWSARFLLSIAAGLVAGESLFGIFALLI